MSSEKLPQTRSVWTWPCVAAALAFALQLALFAPLLHDYFPSDDDLALELASAPIAGPVHPELWFTQGWHRYLDAYPEWTPPAAFFLRPAGNAIYWLQHALFGSYWASRLIAGYLVHSLIVGLAGYIALALFELPLSLACLAMALAALNPGFWSTSYDPYPIGALIHLSSMQLDLYAALGVVIGMVTFVRRRFAWFAAAITVAALIRETALLAPLAALAMPAVWKDERRDRMLRNLGCLLAPIAVYAALRTWVFAPHGPVFALGPFPASALLVNAVKRIVYWPTTLFAISTGDLQRAFRGHDLPTIARSALALMINAGWWLALGIAAARAAALWRRGRPTAVALRWTAALLFAGFLLSFDLLSASREVRYAYVFFAIAPGALFAALSRWRAGTVAVAVLAVGTILFEIAQAATSLSPASLDAYRLIKQSGRQLVGLLETLPPGTRRAYLVDDTLSQNDAPRYLARLAGFQGDLIVINSVLPRVPCAGGGHAPHYRLVGNGASTTLFYAAGACLAPPWQVVPMDRIDASGALNRGPWLRYVFPPGAADITRKWRVTTMDPVCRTEGACVWIGLDVAARRYFLLPYSRSD